LNHLAEDPQGVDVIAWYGGKRTETLANNQLLQPLDDFWQEQQLDNAFSAANKESVSYKQHIYGIPISYYPWGFYYKKSVFARLNLTAPVTWQDFIDTLAVLKVNNLTPIAIGTKEPWPAAGWFDYLILRNNSFAFYKQLMAGKISYNSPEVITALTLWQQLIHNDYFSRSPQKLQGENLLPLIAREIAGVELIGSSSLSNLSDKLKDEFGFFAFPQMKKTKPFEINEIAPLTTLSLLKSSQHKEQALRLLSYFSLPETQSLFNAKKDVLTPHLLWEEYPNELVKQGKYQLDRADHFSQYFDRETDEVMAKFAKQAFADFIEHGDIKRLVTQLEQQRKKVFNVAEIDATF
jgi:multiple sugar transport system substrate-binding protein